MLVAISSALIIFAARISAESDCKSQPIGLQNGKIKEVTISASSWKDANHKPEFAKLVSRNAWCSATEDKRPYLQLSLSEAHQITAIKTRGGGRANRQWVARYEIHYTSNASDTRWKVYQTPNGKPIEGNGHFQRPSQHQFCPPFEAHAIRIYPINTSRSSSYSATQACLKVELYGLRTPRRCREPAVPRNGSLEYQKSKIGNQFLHGKGEIKYKCNTGYKMVGNATITCSDGQWSGAVPECEGICPDLSWPQNGAVRPSKRQYVDGDEVEFYCNPGYDLFGTNKTRCLPDKRWSATVPVCKPKECEPGAKTPVLGLCCCVFPFIYRGTSYNQCTTVDYGSNLWCATVPNYDINPEWQNCV